MAPTSHVHTGGTARHRRQFVMRLGTDRCGAHRRDGSCAAIAVTLLFILASSSRAAAACPSGDAGRGRAHVWRTAREARPPIAAPDGPKISFALATHIHFSFLHFPSFHFAAPTRGVRSAVGAWMHATHPDRHAMTGMLTPHRTTGPSKRARLAFVAHHESPVAAFDMRRSGKPNLRRGALRYPATGTLAFRRSTWDFWPGPVLAVVPPSLKLRRASPPEPDSVDWNHPSDASFKASRGSLGTPSGIVRLSSHGSSLPGGAGLASLPGAVANRIGDATISLRPTGPPPEGAPQERD